MKPTIITIATRNATITFQNKSYVVTIEACYDATNDRYSSWFYFNNDQHDKHLMFEVPTNNSTPDMFLDFIELMIPVYIPRITPELAMYVGTINLNTYFSEYNSLSPSEKKRLLFDAGVFSDDYEYDATTEGDRYVYAQEFYRELRGYRIHSKSTDM